MASFTEKQPNAQQKVFSSFHLLCPPPVIPNSGLTYGHPPTIMMATLFNLSALKLQKYETPTIGEEQ